MARTPVSEPLVASIEKVLRKHRVRRHFMEGGKGYSCFVWINGRCCSSENCLDVSGNVVADLLKVRNVRECHINLD